MVQKKYSMFFVVLPESPNYESSPAQVYAFEQFQQLVSEVDGVGENRERCFEMKRLDCSGQSHNDHEAPDHTHGEHTEAASYRPRRISFLKYKSENGLHTVFRVE